MTLVSATIRSGRSVTQKLLQLHVRHSSSSGADAIAQLEQLLYGVSTTQPESETAAPAEKTLKRSLCSGPKRGNTPFWAT